MFFGKDRLLCRKKEFTFERVMPLMLFSLLVMSILFYLPRANIDLNSITPALTAYAINNARHTSTAINNNPYFWTYLVIIAALIVALIKISPLAAKIIRYGRIVKVDSQKRRAKRRS